ncbi:hypothetical protein KAM429_31940 [Aquipseudomonas alcaligenes]|uniref:Uncharacterized protein n=1 Tax=Aquipseudomonas alcaligenes TaxID=43263 RepID=A0AA37FMP9_AQUAC|nr:hypothetical protein KAM426_01640 [Pseudomonas alcaligenes]GIZ67918.1 hypothetical protein KAM428_30030 [Pseudomonas alcaligenes]GIZ72433.1 hypothetical protein KAM429_31940 [Pseudomonas alcaligenes]GIZ76850.1 hypothetical protein KAM430_32590 [Pseudomonas alcaligenes]GIZ80982.1 hypothetical protein KAM432_30300 [Pseudomonas alcaligenes]
MDGLRHQFLADAGFAGDQHGQVTAGDRVDLRQQAPVRGALADQFGSAGLPGHFAKACGQLALGFGALGQAEQAVVGLDRGRGQAGEGIQVVQVVLREAAGAQAVQRQQAPGALIDVQRAAQAVVHFELADMFLDQAVVGVGQLAIGGEAGRSPLGQQRGEAWVFGHGEAPPEGIRAEAIHRQRH